jgi:predicted nucleotidyltransferase
MRFGLTKTQFKILEELVLKPLLSQKVELFVFGSRARGDFHPFSDIDLLYREVPGHAIDESIISKIKEDIEESSFPIKVDLVNDANLADSYRTSVEKNMIKIEN